MNKVFVFLFIILCSCHSNTQEKTTTAAPITSEEDQLKNAVKQHPDSLILKENLIQFYRDNENYEKALSEVNSALSADSSNPRLWDIKAVLHFENADTLHAIDAFEKEIQLLPGTRAMISLATLYAQVKNKKSLEIADLLVTQHKADTEKEAMFIKGLYYSYQNEKMKSISFFDQCIALNFTFMDAYREKAIALYDLGKYKEAVEVLDKAVTLQNNFDEGYYYRGKCFEKLNRAEDAIDSYQSALMYSPDYTEAKEALSRLGVKN